MDAGGRLFGHPVHPMLTAFPIAFWIGTSLWDGVSLVRPEPMWTQLASWTLVLGVLTALPAMATGFWEMYRLPDGHGAEPTVLWHMSAMGAAWCLCAFSLLLRRESFDGANPSSTSGLAMTIAAGGVVLTLAGGWLGGELVFRHGVGVERRTDSIASDHES